MNNTFIGSNFDDFLEKEDLLAEAESTAIKRVIAFQIQELMKTNRLSKAAMAKQMNTSCTSIERLLDPK